MKKSILIVPILFVASVVNAWWDPGHLVTAMIAYLHLDQETKAKVDELTAVLQRDYVYVNHFIATGPWPDDLKNEGVRAYDSWHYTNIPMNMTGINIPDQPEVDIIWAINEATSILKAPKANKLDKARFLAFLVHFVSDLHQPLHTTSLFDNFQPGGNIGGNAFNLKGTYRNLHALWDDGAGFLSPYNDINPYGQPKQPLTAGQIERIRQLALQLMQAHPEASFQEASVTDPDFWALEGHKYAISHGYRGVNAIDSTGRKIFIRPNDTASDLYLQSAQEVVKKRLALSGYRLARLLKSIFHATPESVEKEEVLRVVDQLLQSIHQKSAELAQPIVMDETLFVSSRIREGQKVTRTSTGKDFLNNLKKDKDPQIERIWNPSISIHGDLATVSAPYDFYAKGQFSHCGTDVFNLLKTAEGWKIVSIIYDVRTADCEPSPLGPPGASGNR